MKVLLTKFKELKIISSKRFIDSRGYFREVFKKKFFKIKHFYLAAHQNQKKCFKRSSYANKAFPR